MESLKNNNSKTKESNHQHHHYNHEYMLSREVQGKVLNAVQDDSRKVITDDMKNVAHKEIVNDVGARLTRMRGY